ncbi:cyclin 3 [Trypanosoma brucei brucei TREU927]|uniref:Cyclin 3 n=1 Tax=Trypanosoma brucei brucei (strain 927/4 GUTat10.1) TaxID=185431 RepID=Q585A1_TRYB2|nr:cyclin 3 [Trypanosoma brucei brucei TREU927]AAX80400.1 cyclin 3 [Trypanosoma brucei]AAZ11709.1 cyclin 3 [Trypanosoma brucei brucei TREU927]
MNIRTTVTLNSIPGPFGDPSSIDYKSHPGEGDTVSHVAIFEMMKKKEMTPLDDIKKLKKSVYSYRNRKIITNWLRDVCVALNLKGTTLCLAIQLTDAFISGSLQTLPIEKCQLAAATCLWDAAKFEEMDNSLPSLKKIVRVCDDAYSSEQILEMEETILCFFKWRLPHTTVINHLYLQLHMLGSEDLVSCGSVVKREPGEIVILNILVVEEDVHKWKRLEATEDCIITSIVPQLCAIAGIPASNNIEVFQVFGENVLVTRRTALDTPLRSLYVDSKRESRLCLSNGGVNFVFVERGTLVVPRNINKRFLNQCQVLVQEVVLHVEFIQLPSHVTALGVLMLSMCILATNMVEGKSAINYIQGKLGISSSRCLAAARLLCVKYRETIEEYRKSVKLPQLPEDIMERLDMCLATRNS